MSSFFETGGHNFITDTRHFSGRSGHLFILTQFFVLYCRWH